MLSRSFSSRCVGIDLDLLFFMNRRVRLRLVFIYHSANDRFRSEGLGALALLIFLGWKEAKILRGSSRSRSG